MRRPRAVDSDVAVPRAGVDRDLVLDGAGVVLLRNGLRTVPRSLLASTRAALPSLIPISMFPEPFTSSA